MNDVAYDISHLLEFEREHAETPAPQPWRMAPTVADTWEQPPNTAAMEEALARELMQFAAAHEALIQQYQAISTKARVESTPAIRDDP